MSHAKSFNVTGFTFAFGGATGFSAAAAEAEVTTTTDVVFLRFDDRPAEGDLLDVSRRFVPAVRTDFIFFAELGFFADFIDATELDFFADFGAVFALEDRELLVVLFGGEVFRRFFGGTAAAAGVFRSAPVFVCDRVRFRTAATGAPAAAAGTEPGAAASTGTRTRARTRGDFRTFRPPPSASSFVSTRPPPSASSSFCEDDAFRYRGRLESKCASRSFETSTTLSMSYASNKARNFEKIKVLVSFASRLIIQRSCKKKMSKKRAGEERLDAREILSPSQLASPSTNKN